MEILFILCMFLPTVLLGFLKIWPLFWVFCIFDGIFGGVEIYYKVKTGKTVSQHFWAYSKQHKTKAIFALSSMLIMWVALIIHLGYKMFK